MAPEPRRSSAYTTLLLLFLLSLSQSPHSTVQAWGLDGHHIICNLAEQMLNPIALAAVEELLPDTVDGNLSSICGWADEVHHSDGYKWSAPLHYIHTPDKLCTYDPERDCRDNAGMPNLCASEAVTNYTDQLKIGGDTYNLTEALFFLAHIVGDIHQPLHVGFEGDKGGKTVEVYWYNSRTTLHHVWDTDIVLRDVAEFFDGDIAAFTQSLANNISTVWRKEAKHWSVCAGGETACPDVYASESIREACKWAYNGVSNGASLTEDYFLSRAPILQKRIAQAAVRLAGILNRIFPDQVF